MRQRPARASVAIYTPLNRLDIQSGVPRHIREIVPRLLGNADLSTSFFVNAAQAEHYLPREGQTWREAPRRTFGPSPGTMQRLWGIVGSPSYESLGGESDWLYLPADGFVPTRRAKLAVTIHDAYRLEEYTPGSSSFRHSADRLRIGPVYWRAARGAKRIFTVSQFSADRIMALLHVPAERIEVIYNGVAPEFYSPDPILWPKAKAKAGLLGDEYFVAVGGLKQKKNGLGILSAWSRFCDRNRGRELLITGHSAPDMAARAQRAGDGVRFAPPLTDGELAVLISRATALLFPSFYEGFGMPAMEALAVGTTVIASDIPVFRELLRDAPLYVDPFDASDIAAAMEEVSSASESYRVRARATRSIATQYTWNKVAERVAEQFKG